MSDYAEIIRQLRNRRMCIQAMGTLNDYPLLGEAADAIKELLQKREAKPGDWVETEMYYDDYAWVCSVCGEPWYLIDGTPAENNMNYCPCCGSRMKGEKKWSKQEQQE